MNNSNAIARRLESIQTKAALHSADVANVLNVRPETVSRWNNGKALPHASTERQLLELEFIVDKLTVIFMSRATRGYGCSRASACYRTAHRPTSFNRATLMRCSPPSTNYSTACISDGITRMIHDPDLPDPRDTLPKEAFDGQVYRATRLRLDPLAGSYNGGRWMTRDAAVALYTSLELEAVELPLRYFNNLGLPSLVPRQEFNSSNRRIRDPYVRWWGREGR